MAETTNQLMDLAARRFNVDRATLSAEADYFEALGIDSIQALDLLTELEEEFEVEIPDYELQDAKTFEKLAELIDERR